MLYVLRAVHVVLWFGDNPRDLTRIYTIMSVDGIASLGNCGMNA